MNKKNIITGSFVNEQIYSKEYNNFFYDFIEQIDFFDPILLEVKNLYTYKICSCNNIEDDNNEYQLSNNWTFKIDKEILNKFIKKIIEIVSKEIQHESLKYYKEIYIDNYSVFNRKQLLNDTKKIFKKIKKLSNLGLQLERFYDIMEQKKENSDIIYYIPEDNYLDKWKELSILKMKERTKEVFLNYENVDGRTNKNVQETFNGRTC